MKNSAKMAFALVAVLCLVTVQFALAAEIEVTGTVDRIGTKSIDLISDGAVYTFHDIPFADLEAAGIFLAVADTVTVKAYIVIFPNGTSKYIAYSLTKGDKTLTWHPNVPKAGSRSAATLSATDANGQPCKCQCVETTVCYECNCYCGERAK